MKKHKVFALLEPPGLLLGSRGNGLWQNQFRLGVASIDPKLIEKHTLFSLLDQPGQFGARAASLFELSGLLLGSRGMARLGMNGLCGILAISHLGMNGLCGILAISHLGGSVDDDDDTPGYPHPPTPSRPGKKHVVRLGSSLR